MPRGRQGFTLIEMMISLGVLSIVGVSFAVSMRSMASLSSSSAARADVQREGAEALERILGELRSSGVANVGGLDYPHLFDDGVPGPGFDAHAHAVPAGAATVNDYDFGVTREIVFLLPADVDGDALPDVDGAGEMAWGANEISYVLDQAADGTVALQRRVNGAAPVNIASDVERVAFDDAATSGFEVPLDAVRVRIFFRARDSEGNEVRYSVEGTTRLRNG
jgi:prepilin-type N-terminal cleavage/methylation domain-containing protein